MGKVIGNVPPLPACSRQKQRQISKHHTTPIFGYACKLSPAHPATARLLGYSRMNYLREKCVMFRTTYLRTISLALAAAGCMAQATAAPSACVGLAGTADGLNQETAVSRAQSALDDYINQYKTENNLDAVTIRPKREEPQPYWRQIGRAHV